MDWYRRGRERAKPIEIQGLRRRAWAHDGIGDGGQCSPQCQACEAERQDIARRLKLMRWPGAGAGGG